MNVCFKCASSSSVAWCSNQECIHQYDYLFWFGRESALENLHITGLDSPLEEIDIGKIAIRLNC